MNELGIVVILLVCGAAIAAAAVIVAKLATRNVAKQAADEDEEARLVAEAEADKRELAESIEADPVKYHYRTKNRVMSDGQQEFYQKLAEVFGERCYIFPNVALAAMLDAEISGQDDVKAMARVAGLTADFVMCHADDLRILCVVVLADDRRVKILKEIGVPVAVMREPGQMDKQQIVDQITAAIRMPRSNHY